MSGVSRVMMRCLRTKGYMCVCVVLLDWPWSEQEEMYGFALVILTRQKQCDPDYSCPCN